MKKQSLFLIMSLLTLTISFYQTKEKNSKVNVQAKKNIVKQ